MSNPAARTPAPVSPESSPATPARAGPTTGRRIELRVAGHLSKLACGAFGDRTVEWAGSETAIRGVLPDPSYVHELLARCHALGLHLTSLRQIPQ